MQWQSATFSFWYSCPLFEVTTLLFIHSAINEHLSNFCFGTVRIMFLWIGVLFNLEVELLNSRVGLSSIAVCSANLFSKVAVPKLYPYSQHENSFCFTPSPTLGVISLNSTRLCIFVTPGYLSFFVLLYLYILVGTEWYLTVILICISLILNGAELLLWIACSRLLPFFYWNICFLLFGRSSFCILDMIPIPLICVAKILFQLLNGCFWWKCS